MGRVTFQGTAPDSTEGVLIVAYPVFPRSRNDLLTFQPFPPPPSLPRPFTGSQFYAVPLGNGRYEWVVAVWKKVGNLTLSANDTTLLRVAGYYRNPADTTQPGSVTVPTGSVTDSVDFKIDFDNLRPATDFVSCTVR